MSTDTIKSIIVQAINLSDYHINLIENSPDGLFIEVQRPIHGSFGEFHSVKTTIRNDDDVGRFTDALRELN